MTGCDIGRVFSSQTGAQSARQILRCSSTDTETRGVGDDFLVLAYRVATDHIGKVFAHM